MSEKTIKLELTLKELRDLSCSNFNRITDIVEKARKTLAEHERDERLAAYRLPWTLNDKGYCYIKDAEGDITLRNLGPEQAQLIAAAPDLAEAADRALAELNHGLRDRVPDSLLHALADLGAALDKSGWPRRDK
jgi:hypothetical protein